MSELLLELFSEEIPARMQRDAAANLKTAATQKLTAEGFSFKTLETYVTPRRLTLLVEGLPKKLESKTVEKRGPRINAPQQALDGFLRSSGLKLEQLEKRGEFYFAVINEEGKETIAALPKIIEELIEGITWPKSMRWGARQISWVRPLQNILCLFDGHVLKVRFGHLEANNITYGHRFLAPAEIKISNFKDYEDKLHAAHVMLASEKRAAAILHNAESVAKQNSYTLKHDERLLEEVSGLVEWPEVLMGTIDSQFMHLPPEVLSTSMRAHQKYFSLLKKGGQMAPNFLLVSNMRAMDKGKFIIAGNERVLRARLSDAKFFFEQDTKVKLETWVAPLGKVTFHAKLGSYLDKVKRIVELAKYIASFTGVDVKKAERAAYLCKADLLSGMVGEFPELQGIMGGYYAEKSGEDKDVSHAIREHYYYPVTYNHDGAPTKNKLSITVAIADKIDTLVGMFAAGEEPTGSKDPFALRRAALSIIGMILENEIPLPIKPLIQKAGATGATGDKIYQFFIERLKHQLKEKIRHDYIDAVLSGGDDDLLKLYKKADALKNFLGTDDGKNLVAAYKRAANIVAAEEKKDNTKYAGAPDTKLLEAQEEKELHAGFVKLKAPIESAIKSEKYAEAMAELSNLRKPVDLFFDKVIVNADKPEIRRNRLYSLSELRQIMDRIANFSKIEG